MGKLEVAVGLDLAHDVKRLGVDYESSQRIEGACEKHEFTLPRSVDEHITARLAHKAPRELSISGNIGPPIGPGHHGITHQDSEKCRCCGDLRRPTLPP